MALVNQSRLLTWLQNSNLQVTNIALYQLITQLIKITAELENITGGTSGGGGSGGIVNNITNIHQFLSDGDGGGGEGDPGPPGVAGTAGAQGPAGATGLTTFLMMELDGINGEDAYPVPGTQGPTGNTGSAGATGQQGTVGVGTDGIDGEDGLSIPSPLALKVFQVGFTTDGSGTAITTGVKGYRSSPVSGTIIGVRLLADVAGSVVVDIWKDTYANYPPTVTDTITASAKPTLSAASKYEDTTLTGWIKAVTAGDVFGFNIDSATTVTRLTLELTIAVAP
jgi:hypothetical protein